MVELGIAYSAKMSSGLLDLPRTFNSNLRTVGLVRKKWSQDSPCETIVLPEVFAHQAVSVVHASGARTTVSLHGDQRRNSAVPVAASAFSRHLSVAVSLRLRHCGLQVLGKRMQCRCISERAALSIESSTSSSGDGNEGEESLESKFDKPFFQDVQIDLNLPRRRMLVEFTCNVCNVRTQRLVNPEAYKRGTVFIQCAGCEAYHQLVDNLNLIQEYDFRKENNTDEM